MSKNLKRTAFINLRFLVYCTQIVIVHAQKIREIFQKIRQLAVSSLLLDASVCHEVLPRYPEPEHVFSPQACHLSIEVDGRRFNSQTRYSHLIYI